MISAERIHKKKAKITTELLVAHFKRFLNSKFWVLRFLGGGVGLFLFFLCICSLLLFCVGKKFLDLKMVT